MVHFSRSILVLLCGLVLLAAPTANAQKSTVAHPCGIAPTQFTTPPDIPRTGTTTRIDMTIKQDGYRLCFVWNGIAEAPTIHARPGDLIVLHVTSEITDPCFINTYFGGTCPGKAGDNRTGASPMAMDMATSQVQAVTGTYPIVGNEVMPATGITNVHTHGLEVSPKLHHDEVVRTEIVPPAMSGAGDGSSSWTYYYNLPATHAPGLYWYHPHRHGETEQQDMMGLSGAIVIEDAKDDRRKAAKIADQVIIVRDIPANQAPATPNIQELLAAAGVTQKVTIGGRSPANGTGNPNAVNDDPRIDQVHEIACKADAPPTLSNQLTVNRHFVQEGPANNATLPAVPMFPGETRLIRLLNASADTFVVPTLELSNAGTRTAMPIQVVGLDGVPLTDAGGKRHIGDYSADKPYPLPPGGRIEFLVEGPGAGGSLLLGSKAYDSGCAGDLMPKRALLRFVGTATPHSQGKFDWSTGATYWLHPSYDRPVQAQRTLAFTEYPHSFTNPATPGFKDFYITEIAGPDVTQAKVKIVPFDMSGPPNIVIKLNGAKARAEEWTVQNYTAEVHVFHIHQIHFRQIDDSTGSTAGSPLLDDITVPPAHVNADGTPGKPSEVKLKLVFLAALAGTFPYHCHLLFHEDAGMMGTIRVVP